MKTNRFSPNVFFIYIEYNAIHNKNSDYSCRGDGGNEAKKCKGHSQTLDGPSQADLDGPSKAWYGSSDT